MLKHMLFALLACVLLAAPAEALAVRTGIVDVEKVLSDSAAAKAANEHLAKVQAVLQKGYADLEKHTPKDYETWRNDIGHAICPQGESVAHLGERIMAELTRIANEIEGKTVAIATHATPIRATQSIIAHGSTDEMKNIPWVSNASVTVCEYDGGKWRIVAASLDGHLGDTKTVLPSYA